MGQAFSNGNAVYVHLERPAYFTGDTVSGLVCVNCVKEFACDKVLLRIEGIEETFWEEEISQTHNHNGNSHSSTFTELRPHTGQHQIFAVQVPLHSYPQVCIPGQYQFPISFQLPLNLPGSFQYSSMCSMRYRNTRAHIKYVVSAECVVPGMFSANLRGGRELVVHQRLTFRPGQLSSESFQAVSCCCCFNKGAARLAATVERGAYTDGEVVNVTLSVDNTSSVDFTCLDLELVRNIRLQAGGSAQRDEVLAARGVFPGVVRGSAFIGSHLSLQLPTALAPTTEGRLVSCTYAVRVTLHATGCCLSNVVLNIPVVVHLRPPQDMAVLTSAPPMWHPTVIGIPVQLNLPCAPPVPPPIVAGMHPGPSTVQRSSSSGSSKSSSGGKGKLMKDPAVDAGQQQVQQQNVASHGQGLEATPMLGPKPDLL